MESNTNFDSLVPEHAKVTEPAQHEAVDHPHHHDEVHSTDIIIISLYILDSCQFFHKPRLVYISTFG